MSFAKHTFNCNLSIVEQYFKSEEHLFTDTVFDLELAEYVLPINTCRSKQLDKYRN